MYGACWVTIYINKAAAEGLSYVSASTSNGNTPHIPHLNRPVFACSSFPSGEFELFKRYERLSYSPLLQMLLQIQAPGRQNIILFWTFFYFLSRQLILQGDSPGGGDLDDFYPSQRPIVCFIRTITRKCCFYEIKLANCLVENQTSTGEKRGGIVFFSFIRTCRRLRLHLSAPHVKADSLTTLWGNTRVFPHNPHTFPQCILLLKEIRHWNIPISCRLTATETGFSAWPSVLWEPGYMSVYFLKMFLIYSSMVHMIPLHHWKFLTK